jgi:hypothetical protein
MNSKPYFEVMKANKSLTPGKGNTSPSRMASINWCTNRINVSMYRTTMQESAFSVEYNLECVISCVIREK